MLVGADGLYLRRWPRMKKWVIHPLSFLSKPCWGVGSLCVCVCEGGGGFTENDIPIVELVFQSFAISGYFPYIL